MPTSRQPENPSAPPTHKRSLNLFIAGFLALQICVPLSYYLGNHGYDERFSWRMFSTLRLRACKVHVLEHVHQRALPVNVERDVHLAWLRLLERMRGPVVDAYLKRRCTLTDAEHVTFDCVCEDTDGHPLPPVQRSLACASGKFSDEAGP